MAEAGRGWPELTKIPALAGIITRPESKTPALAGIESAKIRPWPGIHTASCKNLEFKLQNQKLRLWPEFNLQKPGLGRESTQQAVKL